MVLINFLIQQIYNNSLLVWFYLFKAIPFLVIVNPVKLIWDSPKEFVITYFHCKKVFCLFLSLLFGAKTSTARLLCLSCGSTWWNAAKIKSEASSESSTLETETGRTGFRTRSISTRSNVLTCTNRNWISVEWTNRASTVTSRFWENSLNFVSTITFTRYWWCRVQNNRNVQ